MRRSGFVRFMVAFCFVLYLLPQQVNAACTDNDGDGYGNPGNPNCSNGPSTDCDDNNAAVNPGATEILGNFTDDDCSSSTYDTGGYNIGTPPPPHDVLACDDCHLGIDGR